VDQAVDAIEVHERAEVDDVRDLALDDEARLQALQDRLPDIYLNGDLEQRIPGNLNVSFAYVEGEGLMMGIKDVAVSSGSACTSASLEPSYVLRALGVGDELAHSSIRFGIGRFNTEAEVDRCLDAQASGDETLGYPADYDCDDIRPTAANFLGVRTVNLADELRDGALGVAGMSALAALLIGVSFVSADWSAGTIGTQLLYEPRRAKTIGKGKS